MRRAIIAAVAMLIPGALLAQEAVPESTAVPESAAVPESTAVPEPESSSVELAQPPAEAPPVAQQGKDQVSETYTVKTGDTLWDLSQRFLGNPWYWPKVWSYNPEIENPHWIYPGNLVRFYPSAEELPAMVGQGEPEAIPMPTGELADVSTGSLNGPEQFGQDDDVVAITPGIKIGYTAPRKSALRQDGLITQRELDEAGVIHRAWAEKDMLSTWDKVYVRFRNAGQVRVGEKYTIFRTTGEVIHPYTGDRYGYLTHIVGTARIVSLDKSYVSAIIEHSIEDIHRGDFVGPLGNFDKQILTKANRKQMQGVIIASLVPALPFLGENHVVFIDKGSRDGVEEGNTFTIIRRGDPIMRGEDPRPYPPEDIATLVVVDVKDAASACLVVRSVRELIIGDRAVMIPAGGRGPVAAAQ